MNIGATSWMALDKNGTTEIIGFIIDNVIYTGIDALKLGKSLGRVDGVVTKDMARFMDCADLEPTWAQLSKCETILIWDKGAPRWPELLEQN